VLILGIETSCDETAAAAVEDGKKILSSIVSSQLDLHQRFGGVVPEIASRAHLELICPVIEECLQRAGITLDDIDAVAATAGPGLIGALLIGLASAKSICFAAGKPFIAINHVEAHVYSAFMEHNPVLPAICSVVSGGHTDLIYIEGIGAYTLLGRTRDDAAGEAFDKVSKMLGLGYPGGPAIQEAASRGNPSKAPLPRPYMPESWDFSFSGLKTAALYRIRDKGTGNIPDIAASFQKAVAETIVYKIMKACEEKNVNSVLLAGGVASNKELRKLLERQASAKGIIFQAPSPPLCTDNAAMVAGLGAVKLANGETSSLAVTADPGWVIGEEPGC